jgi:hypothetical protein
MSYKNIFYLKNKDWYYYDEEEDCHKLTDKAPKEAVISYEAFNKLRDEIEFNDGTEEQQQRIIELNELATQPEASRKYDEEQQARAIYGMQ